MTKQKQALETLRIGEISPYLQLFRKYQGMYAKHPNTGRPLCKAEGIIRVMRGQKLEWHDKPGWNIGLLVDHELYARWLNRQNF